ncbi:UDP-N-acetylmuramoyl-L-alanine--D-glutamate ligase [Candidatus Magnetomonas plexicatena]|nr:UDP-N-acetylmuramoyl-L-alanine--D-glutamate ligase [Nitrospirales bacterium LBB_01]
MTTMYKNFKDKAVAVVGLARSGVGAANLCVRLGAKVTVFDLKPCEELENFIQKLDSQVEIKCGNFAEDAFTSFNIVIVSPGVPLNIPSLIRAKAQRVRIIGELELAYLVLEELRKVGAAAYLAITGTNGKSTTTTLLYEILRNSGFKTIIGGNIGFAITEEISKLVKNFEKPREFVSPDYIVTEVSSFQLESIDKFKPKVSAILNITPDHLDRHETMDSYVEAKARIFLNQDAMNFLILNADDPLTRGLAERVGKNGPDVLYFSRKERVRGAFYKDGVIYFNIPELEILCPELVDGTSDSTSPFTFNTANFHIKGGHNIENAMAAALMALVSGCKVTDIWNTLISFKGLEHRLELVTEIDGVKYFNDSKGTNVWSVVKSLESFSEPIVLIAGGRDKSGDFSPLKHLVKERVKALVLIGEAGKKLSEALGDVTDVHFTGDMHEAAKCAKGLAAAGDVVLLSPACASFDMFKDFEERGRVFKEAVLSLTS